MTALKTIDQLFDQIEYFPMQIDLNKHLFRYYKQLEIHANLFSIYQSDDVDESLLGLETMQGLANSKLFQYDQFPQGILNSETEFKFNILNAFKLYVMLQQAIKQKVNFNFDVVSAYERLDRFFKPLTTAPDEDDLRVNKRALERSPELQHTHKTPSVLPSILLLLCMIAAILLMIFSSGMMSLIFQACLYGCSFLIARSMLSADQDLSSEEDVEQNNIYAVQLDYFFEKNHHQQAKINPQ